jgi:two-component system KDP operon response regulator KdpE
MIALIIDDEVQIRKLLRMALEARGYTVREAENGTLGLQEAVFQKPDVILLDLGLPDMDGLEVLKRLREWSDVPLLILSVRDQEDVKVLALENGADDFVTKPFGTAELVARLTAIRRRHHLESEAERVIGPLRVDLAAREVTLHGERVKLAPTEYALLKVLVENAGKIVTHNQMLRAVWGPQAIGQNDYLRVYINHLRKKLACSADSDAVNIQNEPGVGYRLLAGL